MNPVSPVSPLIPFYLETSPDSEGRTLGQIWGWTDAQWEESHDFIQWVFPLKLSRAIAETR